MAMSRKDFESFAADIKWQVVAVDSGDADGAQKINELERFVRNAIMPTLRASNGRFDSQRFLTACGF